jgi:CRISPR-associated protein Cas5h
MRAVSFDVEGDFAAFRDPSVTTNQTVQIIPSKSAVIGLIGAMIGVERSNSLDELYCQEYLNILKTTSIGIKVRTQPSKVTFFTNHRSLKEEKTKPFKTELLTRPHYTIFVKSEEKTIDSLLDTLETKNFKYSPTLGHSYCMARIPSYRRHEAKEVDPMDRWISSVMLDEAMETYEKDGTYGFASGGGSAQLVIERHLHHYFNGDNLERRVLRHLIPLPTDGKESQLQIISLNYPIKHVKFFEIDGDAEEAVCFY